MIVATIPRLKALAASMVILGGVTGPSLAEDTPGAQSSLTVQLLKQLAEQREKRIVAIAEEREALIREIESREKLLEYMEAWAMSSSQRRIEARPLIRGASPRVWERAWDRREMILSKLVHFRDDSRPSIVSGNALNALLTVCGPTAMRRLRLAGKNAPDADDVELSPKARQLLSELENTLVPNALVEQINFKRGASYMKHTGQLGQATMLDLEWPLVLRGPKFTDLRDAIANHRHMAIRELERGEPVSPRTAARLMSVVDRMRAKAGSELTRIIKTTSDVKKHWPYRQALQHADALAHGVVRFVSATKLEHVRVKAFRGDTIEELMAYMYTNAMSFGPAGPNSDVAYSQLFELMIEYYVNGLLIAQVMDTEREDLASVRARDKYLSDLSDSLAAKDNDVIIPALLLVEEMYLRYGGK